MDQHEYRPGEQPREDRVGERQAGGSANTPDFSAEPSLTPPIEAGRAASLPSESAGSVSPDGRSAAAGMKGRAEEAINQGMQGAANRIEHAASRLDSMADEKTLGATGKRAKAGETAHSPADTMESVAEYLRTSDLEGLRGDLERQVREKPMQTLLLGVAAGWVFGKIAR